MSRRPRPPRRPAGDRGFTLVELLISIAIMGIITGAIASAMDVALRNDSAIAERFGGANDSLTATNVFPSDVASTPPGGREVGADLASECAGADPAGSANVVRLTWSERTGTTVVHYRVSYRVLNEASGAGVLVRVSCTSTTGPHTGYGTAQRRQVAGNLVAVPAGWSSGPPAALSSSAPDADDLTLELHLATAPPSIARISGTRMNPGGTLPPPPAGDSFTGLRVQTSSGSPPFTDVGAVVTYSTVVFNAGTTSLASVGISDPAADPGSISCSTSTLAPDGVATCTFTHVVTQADIDNGALSSQTTATATPAAAPVVTALAPAVTVAAVQTPQMTATKATATPSYKVAGDVIDYTLTITNSGNVTLRDLAATDPKADGPAACAVTTLAPGVSTQCLSRYTVGPGDLVIGGSVNTAANVTANDLLGRPLPAATTNSVPVPFQASPAMSAVKQAGQYTYSLPGDVVTYSIDVTNTGNVQLSGLAVSDTKDTDGAVPCVATELAPGATTTCAAAHVVDELDISTGRIVNEATVVATPASGGGVLSVTTNQETVTYSSAPALRITAASLPTTYKAAGDTIGFAFTVRNIGPVPVTDVRVDDARTGVSTACGSGTLASGAQVTCSANYTVAPGDVGSSIISTAITTAISAAGPASATANDVVVNFLPDARLTLTMAAAPSPEFTTLGEVITYTMTIANVGNVPLSSVGITAITIGSAPACNASTLEVGASTTCTSTYTTTSNDASGPPVTNEATAGGTFGSTTTTASSGTVTVSSTVPCSVTAVSANPSTVARNGGTGANRDKLAQDVSVVVESSGRCAGLRLQYYPQGTSPGVIDRMIQYGGVWVYTIQRGNGNKASNWRAGPARVDVLPATGTTALNAAPFYPFTVT